MTALKYFCENAPEYSIVAAGSLLGMPLISYMDQSAFKMFMLDVGLLAAKGNLAPRTLLEGNQIYEQRDLTFPPLFTIMTQM